MVHFFILNISIICLEEKKCFVLYFKSLDSVSCLKAIITLTAIICKHSLLQNIHSIPCIIPSAILVPVSILIPVSTLLIMLTGIPGWRSGLAPAFGPGRDPGDPGSIPRRAPGAWSLLLPLPMSLPLSLSQSV